MIELKALKENADIDSKTVKLEAPSDKALGELKGLGLEALLQFITGENRSAQMKSAENKIEINKQSREANFQKTMDKIEEAIKKAEEEKSASWWKKAFGWVANIVTAIISVAAVVVGTVTANPLLICAGVAGCYFAASGITEQVTGKGLTTMALEACGVPEDIAGYIGMGVDLVGGVVAGIISGGGIAKAAAAANKVVEVGTTIEKTAKISSYAAKTLKIANVVNGATSIGSGVSGGFMAVYRYQGDMLKADQLELKKALEKLLVENEECQKTIKRILEFFNNMTDDVSQVVKDKAQATMNVMTMAPSGGMA
ncbi:MAG: type III secretion system translocon subunit SctE [Succinivibrio sp.]|nr:type III secretion system translocon subunit SctE [Succinivibrio sp.]